MQECGHRYGFRNTATDALWTHTPRVAQTSTLSTLTATGGPGKTTTWLCQPPLWTDASAAEQGTGRNRRMRQAAGVSQTARRSSLVRHRPAGKEAVSSFAPPPVACNVPCWSPPCTAHTFSIPINITCTLTCAGAAYLLPTGVISVRQYRMCIAAAPDYVDYAIKLSPSLGYHFALCSYRDAHTR